MSFEEEFQSLKGLRWIWELIDAPYQEKDNPEMECHWLTDKDIQKHCLDKQRVEKVIDRLKYIVGGNSTTEVVNARILKKELGL